MRALVDVHYPQADVIRVVLDNLSTHSAGALYEAFAPEEARRVLRRLEFHYTPKHASWLNMVEIELSVLSRQCLGRRISDAKRLKREVARWQKRRNLERARIRWRFGVDAARQKLGKSYLLAQATANLAAKLGAPEARPRRYNRQRPAARSGVARRMARARQPVSDPASAGGAHAPSEW